MRAERINLSNVETLQVKTAGPADAEVLLGLIRGLARYEHLEEAATCTEADIRAALSGTCPDLRALIAWSGDRAVGMATFYSAFSSFRGSRLVYLEDLYVIPTARGTGAGRALMTRLARLAKAEGCTGLRWLVLDWNRSAIAFYQSLGARALGGWLPYGVDGPAFDALAEG